MKKDRVELKDSSSNAPNSNRNTPTIAQRKSNKSFEVEKRKLSHEAKTRQILESTYWKPFCGEK